MQVKNYARFASNAFRKEDDKRNPRIAPLHNNSFDSLSLCLFVVARTWSTAWS